MPSLELSGSTHFVVMSFGTTGDLYPFLSLARALQRRGHRVSFVALAFHEALVQQSGVPFCGIGTVEQYLAKVNDPDLWHPRKSFAVLSRDWRSGLKQIHDYLTSLPEHEPSVIVAHPLALSAAALVKGVRADIQIVGAYLAPSNLRTCHDLLTLGPLPIPRWLPMAWRRWLWAQVGKRLIDPFVLPDLNAERQSAGLPAVANVLDHMYSVADFSVTLFPSWFASQQPDWPAPMAMGDFQLYEPESCQVLPESLQRFLTTGAAPVVFTPGTGHRHASGYFAHALAAIQRLGRRAIFLTAHRAQVPATLPASVLWQDYVSLRRLLPQVAALVHHGGIGTTAEALRAGVPQLLVPFAYDQFDNGARVRALGVGDSLSASRLSRARLEKSLRNLLTSQTIAAQCRLMANRFPSESQADALCQQIETAVAVRHPESRRVRVISAEQW